MIEFKKKRLIYLQYWWTFIALGDHIFWALPCCKSDKSKLPKKYPNNSRSDYNYFVFFLENVFVHLILKVEHPSSKIVTLKRRLRGRESSFYMEYAISLCINRIRCINLRPRYGSEGGLYKKS